MKHRLIAREINALAEMDQKMVKGYHTKNKKWDSKLIRSNTAIIKEIVEKYGWPTIELVGKKASNNAWLLVQHSDYDLKFQKKSLKLLKEEYRKNPTNVDPKNVAYLTDRVLAKEKKPQLFGTQYMGNPPKLLPVKDTKNLQARRKEYRLDSNA